MRPLTGIAKDDIFRGQVYDDLFCMIYTRRFKNMMIALGKGTPLAVIEANSFAIMRNYGELREALDSDYLGVGMQLGWYLNIVPVHDAKSFAALDKFWSLVVEEYKHLSTIVPDEQVQKVLDI
jgi:hypothetical protein